MGLKAPSFAQADNPAANCDCWLTRLLTFIYLPVFNFWLLLFPKWLSFDWSMEAIPLIHSIKDTRNASSLIFYSTLFVIIKKCYNYVCSHQTSEKMDIFKSSSNHKTSQYKTTITNEHNLDCLIYKSNLPDCINANQANRNRNCLATINHQCSNSHSIDNKNGFKQSLSSSINGSESSGLFFPIHLFAFTNHKHWSGLTTCLTSNHRSDKTNHTKSSLSKLSHHDNNNNNNHNNKAKGFLSNNNNYVFYKSTCKQLQQQSQLYVNMNENQPKIYSDCDVLMIALMLLIIPFIPASNLFFYVGFVIAERILYIPSMGFTLMVTLGIKILTKDKKMIKTRNLIYALVAIVLVGHSTRTLIRNRDWISEENLYKSGVAINPPKGSVYDCCKRKIREREKKEKDGKLSKKGMKRNPLIH